MALVSDLNRTAVAQDGSTSSWSDDTVYGGANPDRNEMAVYLTAYKVDEDLVETAVTVTTFDPEDATTFTTANAVDGHFKYYYSIIPRWDIAVEYNQYDLVWSVAEQAFYQYTNATPSTGNAVTDSNYFTSVTDPNTKIADVGTDEEPGNLIYEVVQKIVDYYGSVCFLKAGIQNAKETCATDTCNCDSRLGKYYHKIEDLFTSLSMYETTGRYTDGERAARLLEKYCDDCGCSNN